jgi:hypothetical protein
MNDDIDASAATTARLELESHAFSIVIMSSVNARPKMLVPRSQPHENLTIALSCCGSDV